MASLGSSVNPPPSFPLARLLSVFTLQNADGGYQGMVTCLSPHRRERGTRVQALAGRDPAAGGPPPPAAIGAGARVRISLQW